MADDNKRYAGLLIVFSYMSLALLLLWIILMPLTVPSGSYTEQLAMLKEDITLYIINFIIAAFIAFPMATVLILLSLLKTKTESRKINLLIYAFVLLYWLLVSAAYISQVVTLPALVTTTGQNSLDDILYMYFHNPRSLPAFIDFLGYAFFGLAAIILGYKIISLDRIMRTAAIIMWVSGITSILAFAGIAAGINEAGVLSIFSGVMVIPLCILIILWGRKQKSGHIRAINGDNL